MRSQGHNYFAIFPPKKRRTSSKEELKKRSPELASLLSHVPNSVRGEWPWWGTERLYTLQPSLNSWSRSRPVISAIWECELKSRVMATFLLLFLWQSAGWRKQPCFKNTSISHWQYFGSGICESNSCCIVNFEKQVQLHMLQYIIFHLWQSVLLASCPTRQQPAF